jgi:hypothetical protein
MALQGLELISDACRGVKIIIVPLAQQLSRGDFACEIPHCTERQPTRGHIKPDVSATQRVDVLYDLAVSFLGSL